MNLMERYLDYVKETESPYIYHRWCALMGVATLMGRSRYIAHGHKRIFSNNFCLLVGEPASRKSSAILLSRNLLEEAGFTSFAAAKTSKEKFFMDLAGIDVLEEDKSAAKKRVEATDDIFGDPIDTIPKQVYIAADDFTTFSAVGNIAFFDDLGIMWDWDSETVAYKERVKNSKSIAIFQPTINILAGTTSENFNRAFPPETLGTGFLSRLLIIAGKRSKRSFAFPKVPSPQEKMELVGEFAGIYQEAKMQIVPLEMEITGAAKELLTKIYEQEALVVDQRFAYFNQRRFTHLLKMCLSVATIFERSQVDEEVAIAANTYLAAAEFKMPEAIGEFGKGKNSEVANKIVRFIEDAPNSVSVTDIWKQVHKDLDKITALPPILEALSHAGRIQNARGVGWIPKKEVKKLPDYVDWSLLTEEEKDFLL